MTMPLFLLAAAVAGVTDTPCTNLPVPIPPELSAWRESLFAMTYRKPAPMPPAAPLATYAAAVAAWKKVDWPALCKWHADNIRLRALPAAQRDIVFMGDSITENWAFGDPLFYRGGRVNRGISGQTTPQMLVRFPQDVLSLHPRAVHIMAGSNDIAGNTGPTTFDAIEANIAAMVTLAKAARIRVILAATPPSAEFAAAPEMKPALLIVLLNQRLRALAAREHVLFIDYGKALGTPDGALRPELTFDGLHPNAAGYKAMEAVLARTIPLGR